MDQKTPTVLWTPVVQQENLKVPLIGGGTRRAIDLHWVAHYADRTFLNVLQWIREGRLAGMPDRLPYEEQYWTQLDRLRTWLAGTFRARDYQFDLIVDPPSRSGQHRPYLASFRALWPAAAQCHFTKDRPINSGDAGTSFDTLLDAVHLVPPRSGTDPLKAASRIVIVDDVFSSGRTVAVLLEKLEPYVARDARFTVVCPLRTGCSSGDTTAPASQE